MRNDPRLQPWLDLADELDDLARFMHATGLTPRRVTKQGTVEFLDVGEAAAGRMRAVAAKRWTWFSCQRDRMQGEVRAELQTFYRWMSEGCFYNSEDTETGREMMTRLANIERKFKQLDTLSKRR